MKENKSRELVVVMAPSCMGKSIFLESKNLKNMCNPGDLKRHFSLTGAQTGENPGIWKWPHAKRWQRLLSCGPSETGNELVYPSCSLPDVPLKRRAILLVTSKEALIKRTEERHDKAMGVAKGQAHRYKALINYYKKMDLVKFYKQWLYRLEVDALPYKLVDCSTYEYNLISEHRMYELIK